jgi:hypothetical protein
MPIPDEQRLLALKESLADLGHFRRGSVQRRFMRCGKAGCRCTATPPTLHGPYFEWTRKVKGKTVSVRLTEAQATLLQGWVDNAERLDKIVAEMERLSFRLTEPALRAAKQP